MSPNDGAAWRGDWRQRIEELLLAQRAATMDELLVRHPTARLVDLANQLAPNQLAAVQLEWYALDEARARGDLEPCARGLLVRWIHQYMPEGWTNDRRKVAAALAGWSSSISSHMPQYKPITTGLARALIDGGTFPHGWRPDDREDPLLRAAFARLWKEPQLP